VLTVVIRESQFRFRGHLILLEKALNGKFDYYFGFGCMSRRKASRQNPSSFDGKGVVVDVIGKIKEKVLVVGAGDLKRWQRLQKCLMKVFE
jgi:hypothetical protein